MRNIENYFMVKVYFHINYFFKFKGLVRKDQSALFGVIHLFMLSLSYFMT